MGFGGPKVNKFEQAHGNRMAVLDLHSKILDLQPPLGPICFISM